MKKMFALSFLAGALNVNAAEIVSEVKDNRSNAGQGHLSGVMVGAGAGGPIGAIAGVLANAFGGQTTSGLSQHDTYRVQAGSGRSVAATAQNLSVR